MFLRTVRAVLAACLFSLLCWSAAAPARDWFVATNGNDAWSTPGTIASPFKTIARATWDGFAGPGDRILVRGGTYVLTGGEWVSAGGVAGNPLTIEPYQGEHVILDGSGMGSGSVLGIGASHVVVQGFEVRNSPRSGITVWGGDPGGTGTMDIVVRNNLIHDCQRNGIYVGHAIGETTTGVQNVLIEGNTVYHTVLENAARATGSGWSSGIGIAGAQDLVVRANRVYENFGEGIIIGDARRAQVLGNEVYDNFSVNLYICRGTETRHEGNLVYSTGNSAYFRLLDGVWLPASGVQIANENETLWADPIWSSNNVIVNNVFIGNRNAFHYGNYQSGGGMRNVLFAFNTVYGAVQSALDIDADTHSGSEVADNLWVQTAAPIGGGVQSALDGDLTGIGFHHNLWYGGLPQTGARSVSDLTGNPLLVAPGSFTAADYALQPGSPADGAGVALAAVTQDYAGTPRATPPAIGAYEAAAGPLPAPTAAFAATPLTGTAPLSVQFTDQSTAAASWAWTFGDGTGATVQSPSHVYSVAGTFGVTLTVSNATGSNTLTRAGLITVTAAPARRTILFDDFETGIKAWYREGKVTWNTGDPKHGSHAMRFTGNNVWVERSVSTLGSLNPVLSVYMGAKSFEANETLVLYWYNGQSWQTAQTIDRRHPASDGQLHLIEVVLPVAAANNPGFRIGFGMWNSDTADYGFIDDVLLSGVPMNP